MRRLLIFLGALFVVFAVAASAFNLLALGARHTFTVRSSYSGVRSLTVDSGDGDVHLTAAPAGAPVAVAEHVTESFTAPQRHALRPGPGALRLGYSCPTGVPQCSVSYDVAMPAGVSVTVHTGNGTVDANGIASPEVSLRTGNGDINATLSQPATSLTATSGNGDITLVVPDVSYAVHASTGNGNVSDGSLTVDPHSARRIDARSGNGDVTITAAR